MSQLLSMVKWEFILESRYKIIHLSLLSIILYYLSLLAMPAMNTDYFLTVFLFFDPVLIGIMFLGALVLFEKNENTLQALNVTPMETRNYFLSKIIALTTLSIVSALLFLFLVYGFDFHYGYLLSGIILTSVFLILLGFLLVSRCHSINEYLLMMMFSFVILFLPPMLHVSGLYKNDLFYLWPSQASFILFKGVFTPVDVSEAVYAVLYLILWIVVCYYLSKKAYYTHIIMEGG
ncbi:MAG: ABC transporter permease [Methanobacteriota archaeon]